MPSTSRWRRKGFQSPYSADPRRQIARDEEGSYVDLIAVLVVAVQFIGVEWEYVGDEEG